MFSYIFFLKFTYTISIKTRGAVANGIQPILYKFTSNPTALPERNLPLEIQGPVPQSRRNRVDCACVLWSEKDSWSNMILSLYLERTAQISLAEHLYAWEY